MQAIPSSAIDVGSGTNVPLNTPLVKPVASTVRDSVKLPLAFSNSPVPDPDTGLIHVMEMNTITGGTGEFENASGNFMLSRTVQVATGATIGVFNGTLVPEPSYALLLGMSLLGFALARRRR